MVHHTGSKILDHHITLFDQLFGKSDAFRFRKIQQETLLSVSPLVEEGGTIHSGFHVRWADQQSPGQIKAGLGLNFDHFRAQISKMHSTEGTSPHPGKICHPHAFERKSGARGLTSGVRRPEFRWSCLDSSKTCVDLSKTRFDFFVVFPQQRSRAANLPPWLVELIGRSEVRECACTRMSDVNKEVPRAQLFLSGEVSHGKHWRKANTPFLAGAKQVSYSPTLDPFVQVLL